MGKKQKAVLDKMYPTFIEGGKANGHPEDKLGKIWKDWEAFASYAFNKSHSTCYALVAYQTAYLKAHYPAEYMASVLTHNRTDQTKLTFFLKECKRMDVEVLRPRHQREPGRIRGQQARCHPHRHDGPEGGRRRPGRGDPAGPQGRRALRIRLPPACSASSRARSTSGCSKPSWMPGPSTASTRCTGRSTSRPSEKYDSYLEHVTKYANAYQSQLASAASSLFGAIQDEVLPDEPSPPEAREWNLPEKLMREKEVTGVYVSGHPLDGYKLEIDNYITCSLG